MSQRLLLTLGLLAIPFAVAPGEARATGSERTLTGHDLVVHVDSRWAGCRYGGYYPIRLRVLNKGPARHLTFRFQPDRDEALPRVQRSVDLEQNATIAFSLSVPMAGPGWDGTLQVLNGGDPLGGLSMGITLPEPVSGDPRPSLLVVSPRVVDLSSFEQGFNELVYSGAYGMAGRLGGHSHGATSEDHEVVPSSSLPSNWIDYTGLDLVAIPLETLTKLGDDERDALLKWVDTGGTLMVSGLETLPAKSEPLETSLRLDGRAAIGRDWRNLLPELLGTGQYGPAGPMIVGGQAELFEIPGLTPEENADRTTEFLLAIRDEKTVDLTETLERVLGDSDRAEGALQKAADITTRRHNEWRNAIRSEWASTGTVPCVRNVGLGRVVTFIGDPFPGSTRDWAIFFGQVLPAEGVMYDAGTSNGLGWPARHGVVARMPSGDFDRFLIPGVRSVPVVSFLVLITLFTLVIGPLNYVVLWRQRRLNLLVLTIPVIALVTSVTLFAYSTISHGFSIRSRVRSVTLLDQRNKTAVTTSRVALFAGMAPSRGLRFSPETAVYPVWPAQGGFRQAHVDWSDTQAFDSGWLRSRTRTQFLVVQHGPARGRIEVAAPEGDGVVVMNGLEQDVEFLLVRGDDGRDYAGRDLPAGATVTLPLATSDDHVHLYVLLGRNPMTMPEAGAFGGSAYDDYDAYGPHGYGEYSRTPPIVYSGNIGERLISRVTSIATLGDRNLPPNSYVAIVAENPEVDLGIEGTDAEAGFHLLVGFR